MLKLIKKIFIGLLTGIVNGCNHKKCFSLSNQKCKIQPILINYILMNTVKNFTIIHFQLNYIKCVRSCYTLNDLSKKTYIPNKTEDSNLSMLNKITGINGSKTLTKHK